MKVNRLKKAELSRKLSEIASNVAKKPIFVVANNNGSFDILNYYTKQPVIQHIPSKSLSKFLCDSFNSSRKKVSYNTIQHYINVYSKHYYDCEFYKHTIKTTKDGFKRAVTITRLDISIEYLKLTANTIRRSC